MRSKWKRSSDFGKIAFDVLYCVSYRFHVRFKKLQRKKIRVNEIVNVIRCTPRLGFSPRLSYVEEDIRKSGSPERHTWPPIIPASHPTAPSSFSAAPLPSPLNLNPWLLNARLFNGPPQSETPGKIIQISSLRFPSNPDERGRSTRVDAQHAGLAPGTRVPTDVYQSGPDYKPAITDRSRTAGRSAEKRGPSQ